ncbi:MAG: replicative DNA helicase, partial [Proteobacteria bacterium]|nr:replicative DNA helicase [Pseudomonadota bacterium]
MAEPDYTDYPPVGDFQPDRDIARIKMAPHSIEAERSVLGGILIANDVWDSIVEVVSAADFYRHDHRVIFRQ